MKKIISFVLLWGLLSPLAAAQICQEFDENMNLLIQAIAGIETPEVFLCAGGNRHVQFRRYKNDIRFEEPSMEVGIFHETIFLDHLVSDLLMPENRVGIFYIVDVASFVGGGRHVFIFAVPLILLAASSGDAVGMERIYVLHRSIPQEGIMVICVLEDVYGLTGVQSQEPNIRMMDI